MEVSGPRPARTLAYPTTGPLLQAHGGHALHAAGDRGTRRPQAKGSPLHAPTTTAADDRVQRLIEERFAVDGVFIYEPSDCNDWQLFDRYARAGFGLLMCHPAGDNHGIKEAVLRIAALRADVQRHANRYTLVGSLDDLQQARASGRLGICIQLEGLRCIERELSMLEVYHALGVRIVHPIFNVPNCFGGGAVEGRDIGLTRWGKLAVKEMNRLGIIVDGAHAGPRAALDMVETSTAPAVFSHGGAEAIHRQPRNFSDELIDAVAASGGVVGISGAGYYLGGSPTPERYVRHVDHVAQRVGAQHVAMSLDYAFDTPALERFFAEHPDEWPGYGEGFWSPVAFLPPESLADVASRLFRLGYSERDVRGVMGENWLRVCQAVWQ
jgi:membrane dipeptidase